MSRILITGGTSPVGAALARRLVTDGHEVRILSRGNGHHRLGGLDYRIVPGDVRDPWAVSAAADGCDGIVHAAYAPAGSPDAEILDTATRGILAVLEACAEQKVPELLLVSSPLAADPQPGVYGTGKRLAEMMAMASAVPPRMVIARPYNVYGPDCGEGHVIPQFIRRVQILIRAGARDPLPFAVRGDGTEVRSFIYADDCAGRLAALLGGDGDRLAVQDVGASDLRTIASVARDTAALFGREIVIVPSPAPSGMPRRRVTTQGKPPETPFSEGLARTVTWYREHDQEAVHG